MYEDLKKYDKWVLDLLRYTSVDELIRVFDKAIVRPALEKADSLLLEKARQPRFRNASDYG